MAITGWNQSQKCIKGKNNGHRRNDSGNNKYSEATEIFSKTGDVRIA